MQGVAQALRAGKEKATGCAAHPLRCLPNLAVVARARVEADSRAQNRTFPSVCPTGLASLVRRRILLLKKMYGVC